MKIRLIYKSFNASDRTYYKGDIIDDPEAQELLDRFPTWFEKVEEEKEYKEEVSEEMSTKEFSKEIDVFFEEAPPVDEMVTEEVSITKKISKGKKP